MGFVAGLEIGDVVVCGASGTASCSQAVKLSISDKLLVFSRLLQSIVPGRVVDNGERKSRRWHR